MADYSHAENMTRVDTDGMRETAASIQGNLRSVKAALDELVGVFRLLYGSPGGGEWQTVASQLLNKSSGIGEGVWLGPASKAYNSVFNSKIAKIRSAYDLYAELPSYMILHAEEYERAHGIAVSVAESIEQATWAEA